MAAFSPLLDMLAEVPDPRRAEGKLYTLPHVLLFSILAIVTGCNSYRGIVTCLVPGSRDATLTRKGEEALWQAVFMAAPERRREFEPSSERRKKRPAPWPSATG